jgi:hypothetical protein
LPTSPSRRREGTRRYVAFLLSAFTFVSFLSIYLLLPSEIFPRTWEVCFSTKGEHHGTSHGQDDAKFGLPAHHARVSFGRLCERILFDHGAQCWVLDALFHWLPSGGPRLLFKGGTSLSKAFGLISRFSEDIDITVFREDLGQAVTVAQLEALSRKKRNARLDEIKLACQHYINSQLRQILADLIDETAKRFRRGRQAVHGYP